MPDTNQERKTPEQRAFEILYSTIPRDELATQIVKLEDDNKALRELIGCLEQCIEPDIFALIRNGFDVEVSA